MILKDLFTMLQADFKIPGLPVRIVEEAIHKATGLNMFNVSSQCDHPQAPS